jgi:hypothetical protein
MHPTEAESYYSHDIASVLTDLKCRGRGSAGAASLMTEMSSRLDVFVAKYFPRSETQQKELKDVLLKRVESYMNGVTNLEIMTECINFLNQMRRVAYGAGSEIKVGGKFLTPADADADAKRRLLTTLEDPEQLKVSVTPFNLGLELVRKNLPSGGAQGADVALFNDYANAMTQYLMSHKSSFGGSIITDLLSSGYAARGIETIAQQLAEPLTHN